jgi:endonuclease/exonuclease/phosphatase family metal-dependent hydrolase
MKVVVCQRELNRREWQALPSRIFTFITLLLGLAAPAAAQDVVLYPSDMTTIQGHYWSRPSSSSGADGQKLSSMDWGWASTAVPVPWPNDFVEATFQAQAGVDYQIWVRVRAIGDSKWNDSLWVQFNDSIDSSGNAAYRIGTESAYLVNLEACNGCGVSGWGWSGGAWWLEQRRVRFPSSGTKTIRMQLREDGVEFDQIVLSPSSYLSNAPGSTRNDATILPRSNGSSSGGTDSGAQTSAKALPGRVEAEDFDSGANGSAYWDADGGNNGGAYRSTDVDIEPSSEGGHNVGWTIPGEWTNYTVNVAAAGTYTLDLRVAAPWGASMRVEFNGSDKTGSITLPSTGGWQSWTTVRKTVSLSAGKQTMRVVFDTGNANLNYIDVTSGGGSGGGGSNPPPSASGPYGGSAHAIPGTVQSEDFDEGGSGVGYHDATSGNSGGAYRNTDVDIEATSNGGHAVGWIGAGEWLNYSVNVSSGGTYTLTARVASAGSGGTFHVEFNGQDKTGAMRIPNTGSWTTYQDLSVTVQLDGGAQNMRVVFDTNGSTGGVGNISFVRLEQGSAPAPEPAPSPEPPPSSGSDGGRLRVMTWNIHFGHGGVWEQAQEIANANVDVVLLQEAQTWDEHMPTTYPERLRQITGQQWYSKWAPGDSCGGGCQGTLILSRLPIVDSSHTVFSGTPVGRVAVDVGGVRVNLFTVHLEYYDTSKRSSQLQQLMDWTRQFGGPRIVGGDFNSWWDEWWIHHMETEYTDTWQDVTGSEENGYTLNGAVRFDYLFRAHEGNWRLTPVSADVRWTSLSDHAPLVAEYTVR